MAISISFGIAYATILTLLVLPLFLAFSNNIKTRGKWLYTGKKVTKEEVERAIKEQNEENNH
jgi:predicted RND superfamily exporter protein